LQALLTALQVVKQALDGRLVQPLAEQDEGLPIREP